MSQNSTNDLEISVDSYATFDAILAHVPHLTLDNINTRPRRRQACEIARQTFDEINGLLKVLGYIIPVGSGNGTSIGHIARMSAVGTAKSLEAAAASVDGRSSDTADFLQREYQRMWTSLKDGSVTLPDASRSNPTRHEGERKPSYAFDQVSSTEVAPTFTKGMDW